MESVDVVVCTLFKNVYGGGLISLWFYEWNKDFSTKECFTSQGSPQFFDAFKIIRLVEVLQTGVYLSVDLIMGAESLPV